MNRETINRIEMTDENELFLGLDCEGKSIYQYIYRESAGVYWDEKSHGFKSTELKEWSHSKWFSHITDVVKSSLGVELYLSDKVKWNNIPKKEMIIISKEHAVK